MRLALIIRSTYAENGIIPARNAFEDTGALVQARLSICDTGFDVLAMPASRNLPENLDKLLAEYSGKLEGLLVHFAGYLAVKSDRGPALLLDGARLRAFPVSRLRAVINNAAQYAFTIMDVVAVAEAAIDVNAVVSGLGNALHESTPHVSALLSVALPEQINPQRRGCSRLTDLWLLSLDAQARHADGAAVFSEPVARGVQCEPLSFANLPSFDYRPSEQDFILLPGPQVGGHPELAPAYNRSTLQSAVAKPPHVAADSSPLADARSDVHGQAKTASDDTMVDSKPATQVTDDDVVKDEDLPSIPPTMGYQSTIKEPAKPQRSAALPIRSELRAGNHPEVGDEEPTSSPAPPRDRIETLPGVTAQSSISSDTAPRPSQPASEDPIDRAIDRADTLAYRRDTVAAAAEYKRLISELKPMADSRLSTLYASLGEQYRALWDIPNALTAFEESLVLDASDDVAYNGVCEIYRERHDWESLSQTVRGRLHTTMDARKKTDLLDMLADVWLSQANDAKRAISVIEERLALTPNDIPTLERLIEAYDRDGDTLARNVQREKLAGVLDSMPAQKSVMLVESAKIALQQLENIESAQSFVDRAIEADPKSIEAFEFGIEILNLQKRWPDVLRHCVRVLSDCDEPDIRYQAASRLLDLIEARGPSFEITTAVIDRLRRSVSADEELTSRAVNILENRESYALTTTMLHNTLGLDPRHEPSLLSLSDAAARQHDSDVAAVTSAVLISLECGRPEDEQRSAELVTDKLAEAKRTLVESDFTEMLLVHDVDISIFGALSRVHEAWIDPTLASKYSGGVFPKDASILDSTSATDTVARTIAWAARFVGVELPELVVLQEHSTHLEMILGVRPRLLLKMELLGRLPWPQLAFLTSCHLSLLRQEFMWRAALATQSRVASAIGVCVQYAHKGSDFLKSVDASEREIANRFSAQIEKEDSLAEEITQLFRNYELETTAWEKLAQLCIRAADRSMLRVGLVACANPVMAYAAAKLSPLVSPLTVADQLDEIARFATSRAHLTLRKSLGLNVPEPRATPPWECSE